jgi:hypothetical protein
MKQKSYLLTVAVLMLLVSFSCIGKTRVPVTPEQRATFIGHLSNLVERAYLYPEKGARLAQELRKRQEAAEFEGYGDAEAFAKALTELLRRSSNDLHFNIKAAPAAEDDAAGFLDARRAGLESLRNDFSGFRQVSNLGDGVGYLSYSVFRDQGRADLDATLRLLRHADAVVLDLRGHRGGTEEMTNALLSHFLPTRTHLSDTFGRGGFVSHDYTADLPAGATRIEAPLFVLVDRGTASGAEAAAFHLQNLKRATITGRTTMGAAHSGGTWNIDGFSIFIPNERHVDPKTGNSWEGVGVVPDIVMSDGDAMTATLALAKSAAARYGESRRRAQHALLERLRQEAEAAPTDGADPQWAATKRVLADAIAAGILDEAGVNDLGYLFLGQKRFGAALAVLAGNAALHPQSANAHDSLAEAFEAAGRLQDALHHYQVAVDLAVAQGATTVEAHRKGLERVSAKVEHAR